MFHLKKDQDFYTFILKKIDIHSNFINNNKKINRNTIFSKINYKNVSILFYLPEIIYCLILLKNK